MDDDELRRARNRAIERSQSARHRELEDYIVGLESEIARAQAKSPRSASTAAAPRRCSSDSSHTASTADLVQIGTKPRNVVRG